MLQSAILSWIIHILGLQIPHLQNERVEIDQVPVSDNDELLFGYSSH